MNVGVLVVCCLLATSVTAGNEDEREEFDFDLEMSFEAEEINGPVDSLAAVPTSTVTTKPGALKSPTAESEPVPEPVPEPSPKLTKANQSTNAKLDIKRKTPYSFEYAVEDSKSGLDYGHKESSDGEIVTGTYYVLLPDGRKEIVKYKADGNGYVADVSYEGEAKNDNAQSQKAAGTFASSSGTSAQLQAYSNSSSPVSMVSTLNTPTRPPQMSSSMSSVTTKGPSLLPSTPAAGTPASSGKASVVSTDASAVSSISSIVSATTTITTPSPFASSTLTIIPSSILTFTTPTTTVTAATTTPSTATIAPTKGTNTRTTISTNATNATPINNGTTTLTTNTPTNRTITIPTTATNTSPTSATTTPVNGTTTPTTTPTSVITTTISAANSTSINGATIPTNATNNATTTPTSPINTTSSISNPAVIATSTARSLSSTTSSSVPKSTLNSTFSPVSVTVSASLSLSNQNSSSVPLPQLSQTNKTQVTSTLASSASSTRYPDNSSSLTLNMVSQAPGTPPSENQSFFQALAGFIRSAGPTFIYCRNLLPSCSDSTRFPQASFCSNCNSLQKICSKSESIGETPPIYNDTLQAFQTLVPAAPVWPANKSPVPVAELVQKVADSSSSEKSPNSNSTLPPATNPSPFNQVPQPSSLPNKIVSLEVPEGLADIVQSADAHFSYCQKIRPFCPRLESTRPYWESSSETPSKQKEFLLSTIQACSYCRSLWPICSEMVESSEFLLDPSQLFTLRGLEEDVRNAMFTISYCRNSTQDCNQLLKANQSTTASPIQSMAPQTTNGTSPALFPNSKPSTVTVDDKPMPGSSVSSQIPEPQTEDLGDLKFSNYCSRMTPVCSQLLSV